MNPPGVLRFGPPLEPPEVCVTSSLWGQISLVIPMLCCYLGLQSPPKCVCVCHKLYQISLVIPLVVLRSSRDPEVRHNLYLGPDSAGESPGVLRFRALLAAQAVGHKLYLGQISFVNPPGVPAEFPCNDLGAREAKRRPCSIWPRVTASHFPGLKRGRRNGRSRLNHNTIYLTLFSPPTKVSHNIVWDLKEGPPEPGKVSHNLSPPSLAPY